MASSGIKSNNKKKTSSKSKTSNTKKKTQKQLKLEQEQREMRRKGRAQVAAIIIFAIAILLFCLAVIPSDGGIWGVAHDAILGTFGFSSYIMPFFVMFMAYEISKEKSYFGIRKCVEGFFLCTFICSLIYIIISEGSESLIEGVSAEFYSSAPKCGAVAALIGEALLLLGASKAPAIAINVILILVSTIFISGLTLSNFLSALKKPIKSATDYTVEKLGEASVASDENEIEERKKTNKYLIKEDAIDSPDEDKKKKNETKADKSEKTEEIKVDKKEKKKQPEPVVSEKNKSEMAHIFGTVIDDAIDSIGTLEDDVPGEYASVTNLETGEKTYDSEDESEIISFTQAAEQITHAQVVEEEKKIGAQINTEKETPDYVFPPIDLLNKPLKGKISTNQADLKKNSERLIEALESFNVQATISDIVPGPAVTRFEVRPAPGVKISKIAGLADDIAMCLASPAGVRIEAPIPNKSAVGIEVPNSERTVVTLREIIESKAFKNSKSKINVALGNDIAGSAVCCDIGKMPHLLVAGTTGSGKSVCLNAMIVSILYNATPDEVKLLLIDPKQVEFSVYNGLPHLIVPVVSEPRKAAGALSWAVTEMNNRYKTFSEYGTRDIDAYNALCDNHPELKKLSKIVIIIDELSDLMTVSSKEVEESIMRLAQMARAAGMHLVIATQRPSTDVITGVIKANIPSRIALSVSSGVDSRVILDSLGAEKLLGLGDMLYNPVGKTKPVRVQGCYLSDSEIEAVTNFIKNQGGEAAYDSNVQHEIDENALRATQKNSSGSSGEGEGKMSDADEQIVMKAAELVITTPEKASISALQRSLSLGFSKAGRIMDELERRGVVGPTAGSKPRKVLMTMTDWYEMNALSNADENPANNIEQSDE